MREPRKNYSPSERVAILRRYLIDRAPTCDLCDEISRPRFLHFTLNHHGPGTMPACPAEVAMIKPFARNLKGWGSVEA
jgi:hypothetical protein